MISSFAFPTPILHGPGALRELPARLSALEGHRPFVVTDPGLLPTPAFQALRDVLPEAGVFSGVHPNPLKAEVDAAAAAYGELGCACVIGFGGGSALDVAKIVRAAVVP